MRIIYLHIVRTTSCPARRKQKQSKIVIIENWDLDVLIYFLKLFFTDSGVVAVYQPLYKIFASIIEIEDLRKINDDAHFDSIFYYLTKKPLKINGIRELNPPKNWRNW